MARKLVKRDWNQPKGGYTPFAKPTAKAANAPCYCKDVWDRVHKMWVTELCGVHR
jgi:hypothetical protein